MTSNPIDETFFVAGGTLKATTPSYVKRPADDELFEAVMDGQLCYVLTPRQMGKSSLMTRTSRHLEEHGIRTASIDLTSIGTQVTAQQWYTSIISLLSRKLNLGVDAPEWCKRQEGLAYVQVLITFIEEIILEKIAGRVVVFIDEIDSTLKLDFRDDFFAGLRAIYNARTDKPAFERISFVLLGVASPSDLIADRARTPFNIGRAVALQEFDFEYARVLQDGLDTVYSGMGEQILKRIFHWTNGHPYLTQKLCSEIVERQRETWTDAEIDQLVYELFISEQARKETNLKFVQDRLLDNPRRSALLDLYQRILRGKVREEGQSALQNELKLSGLVRVEDGLLKVRNLIYATVFNLKWVQAYMPKNWPKLVAIVLAIFSLALFLVFTYDFVVGNLSKQYAGDVFTARTANERLQSLANMFGLKGIFTSNYPFRARELFYNLKWEEQEGLFTDADVTPANKQKYLVPVVRGLYVTMANVPRSQENSTELLDAINKALKGVDSHESRELQQEISLWLSARRAWDNGNRQDAIAKYNQAVDLNTNNLSIYYERAQLALQLGLYEKALNDLDITMLLAQNLSTEENERGIPSPTPWSNQVIAPIDGPTSHITPLATKLEATSALISETETILPTALLAQHTASPTLSTPTFQPTVTPYGLRPPYRSNFFSIAYIRSSIDLLIQQAKSESDFLEFTATLSDNSYPNLKSAGLLPYLGNPTTPAFISTLSPAPISTGFITITPPIETLSPPALFANQRIAYAAGGEQSEKRSIFIKYLDDSKADARITSGTDQFGDNFPTFSPDGNSLAFSRCFLRRTDGCELFVKDLSVGDVQVVLSGHKVMRPKWCDSASSSYRDWVVFEDRRKNGNDYQDTASSLGLVNTKTGEFEKLTSGLSDWAPNWSPDCSQIVFTRYDDNDTVGLNADLMLLDLNTRNINPIIGSGDFSPPAEISSAWSPNGEWIAYRKTDDTTGDGIYSASQDRTDLWLVRPDGSDGYAIISNLYNVAWISWSPDSEKIVFITQTQQMFICDVQGRIIFGFDGSYLHPDWAP